MRDEPKLIPGLAITVAGLPGGQVATHLLDTEGDQLVLVTGDGEPLPHLGPGLALQLLLRSPAGLWSGESISIGERIADDERQWLVTRPASWERAQRRGYFRLPIELPFLWTPVDQGGPWQSAVTLDLSAGGLSFVDRVDHGLQPGKRIVIRLALGHEVLELQGEVVRLSAVDSGNPAPDQDWVMGIRFVEVSPRTEERLVRYIFQVESARRRLNRARTVWGNEA